MKLPRSLRGRLTLVLTVGSILLLVALITGFNLVLRAGQRTDLRSRLRARASAALTDVELRGGRVRVREAPGDQAIDQGIWVYYRGRAIESPRAGAAADAAASRAAARPRHLTEAPVLDIELYAEPVAHVPGATVVASASLGPYEASARRVLLGSLVLGLIVLAGILVAVRLAINAALRPVARMTAEASAWSVDDVDHRFVEPGTRDELARLATTFNELLARISASMRHEQRFSAEVSHELRTPLSKLLVETELALRRERSPEDYRAALQAIAADARQMQAVTETLLAVARAEIDPRSGTADARVVAERAIATVQGPAGSPVEIGLVAPGVAARIGVDADVAERVLAPVLANSLKFAQARASVALRRSGGVVEFVVSDDGPGVPRADREWIFAPGTRSRSAEHAGINGTGLGLALARRLARAVGGDVVCTGSDSDTEFVVSLPSA